jgi:predicted  nucleic acid-binding Zn-ribbon protein
VRLEVQVEEDRLGRLEQELRQVRDELAALQAQFAGFRKQFE